MHREIPCSDARSVLDSTPSLFSYCIGYHGGGVHGGSGDEDKETFYEHEFSLKKLNVQNSHIKNKCSK